MEIVANLWFGLGVALSPANALFCLIGVLIGTIIGVLPGIGPIATIGILLPISFHLEPAASLIMLAGIYYGAQYGGSTTAILANMPGESSSVVTALDGYRLAQKGRAGAALAIAALSSFLAGTVATLIIAVAAPPLSRVALSFAPADYFALMTLGLVGTIVLASGSVLKALAMVFAGIFLGSVGIDVSSGLRRYTFGVPELAEGLNFVALALGLFGIAEILQHLRGREARPQIAVIGPLMPSGDELRAAAPAAIRGTLIGSALGVLPGGGALLSSFAAYALEKKIARDPDRFGKGAIEGVAAPEAGNNGGAQTSFIPMLTLGIPSSPVMGLMMGALIIHGIVPGPEVMTKRPEIFWGVIASMWIGNLMLLVINLPLIGLFVKMMSVPYRILFPSIVLFSCIGVYSVNNATFDVMSLAAFSALGYALVRLGCEPAPLLLGFILGPLMEEYLRRALVLSNGELGVFVTRPISLTFLSVAFVLLCAVIFPAIRRRREKAF